MTLPHSDKFSQRNTEQCWLWHGARNERGYGVCRLAGRLRKAHHVIYEAITGKAVTPGLELDHGCRNRACVNPYHLEEMTHTRNMQRMWHHRKKALTQAA